MAKKFTINITHKTVNSLEGKKDQNNFIKEKTPVFSNVDEFFATFKSLETFIRELSKMNEKKNEQLTQLEEELYKEDKLQKDDKIIFFNIKRIEQLIDKLTKLKERNKTLKIIKNKLLTLKNVKDFFIQNKNYIHYNGNITERSEENQKKLNLCEKIIAMLLNYEINIETYTGNENLYHFLKNPNEINTKKGDKEYLKVLYFLKMLERLFIKLSEKSEKIKSNIGDKELYIKYEAIIDKKNKLLKIKQRKNEEIRQALKKEVKIMSKSNKIIIIPHKKVDPYDKNVIKSNILKEIREKKRKEEVYNEDYENYRGFIFN